MRFRSRGELDRLRVVLRVVAELVGVGEAQVKQLLAGLVERQAGNARIDVVWRIGAEPVAEVIAGAKAARLERHPLIEEGLIRGNAGVAVGARHGAVGGEQGKV